MEGALYNTGYGELWKDGKRGLAHRISYELANGEIPKGYVVMHSCDNPPCVNPSHLHAAPQKDNLEDMHRKGRTLWGKGTSGEKNGMSKLSSIQVEEIRAKYLSGNYTLFQLGEEYKTHLTNVGYIVRGKTRRLG